MTAPFPPLSKLPPLHVLRGLLRHLNKHCPSSHIKPAVVSTTPPPAAPSVHDERRGDRSASRDFSIRGYILNQYRILSTKEEQHSHSSSSSHVTPQQNQNQQQQPRTAGGWNNDSDSHQRSAAVLANDYYALQIALRQRKHLYELDGGAENKLTPHEFARRAAARAGLQLPTLVQQQDHFHCPTSAAAAAVDNDDDEKRITNRRTHEPLYDNS